MTTQESIKLAARQCAFLDLLIEEAEACSDRDRKVLLYGMAKDESANLSKSLRQYLSRKFPAHKLNGNAAA